MNKIYRLIWSKVKKRWIVASEKVPKGSRPSSVVGALTLAAFLATAGTAFSLDLNTLPTGGTITSGSGTIATSGNQMTINQSTQQMIANWSTFNIGQNAGVRFNQSNAAATALNRIYDQNPSQIFGTLSANGRVFLLNPSGIIFGQSARVDVGGLVASSLNMLDSDFLAGKYTFTNTGSAGSILNQGIINAMPGGVVALIAPQVTNEGTIIANSGSVFFAAGNQVSLDFKGDGLISYTIDQGAVDALAANKGLIKADGGLVFMTAKAADALTQAVVNNSGVIEAQTLQNKNGRILLLSDMEHGETIVSGKLDASAPNGGDGGFIETSAAKVNVADEARITTAAAQGATGTWLIDPPDYNIAASGGDITGANLSANLDSTNVTILSSDGTTGINGDVNVNDAVSWSANTSLTLSAYRNVNVNSNITATGNTAGLTLTPNTGGGGGSYYLNNGAVITLSGLTPSLTMAGNAYTVINEANGGATALQNMSSGLAGYYALGSNIDATATSTWNAGLGFAPIGNNSTPFTGQFDGLGHTITNLTINRPSQDYVGLFGYTGSGSTVSNVGLVGGSVSGHEYVGELIGWNNYGIVTNANATGSVSSTYSFVGGLVGENHHGTITNAYATGSVSATGSASASYYYVGGLVGQNAYGTISNSYATGNVIGYSGVSGLVGENYSGTITNAYATGNVIGNENVGGLVGWAIGGSISNAYATGLVNDGVVAPTVGGLVGFNDSGTISNSYWDTTTSCTSTGIGNGGTGATGLTTAQMMDTANMPGLDFTNTWFLIPGNTRPFLRMEYSTNIINAHQLQLMAMNLGASYTLGANIDMAELTNPSGMWGTQSTTILTGITTSFAPIGNSSTPFTGQFEGLNHTITNLTINRLSQNYVGLFGYTSGGSAVRNVGLVGGSVSGSNYVGGLVGVNYGTVSNAYATGNVSGGYGVGGLVGYNNGSVSNAYATGSVSGSTRGGGLAGFNYGSISNAYATGSVTGSNIVGGLVAQNGGSISNAYATGSVSGSSQVGGLVGYNNGGTVSNSYWDTITTGQATSAGGTGLTTTQMMKMSSFSGWDIANTGGTSAVWRIYEGNTYPLLRSFLTPLTVTADNVSKTYNGLVWSGTLSGVTYSDPAAPTSGHLLGTGAYVNAINAGTYAPGFWSDQQGYDISYVNGTLTVNPAALSVTANADSKIYNGLAYSGGNGVTYSGFVNSETSAVLGGSLAYSGSSQGAINVGGYAITPGGLTSGNYTISFIDGVLTITPQPITTAQLGAPPQEKPVPPSITSPSSSPPPPVLDTGAPSGGITVHVVSQPTSRAAGVITVTIPDNLARPGSGFSFPLPEQIAQAAAASASAEKVSMPDGGPLPAWLQYNPDSKIFVASNVPDGFLSITVLVTVGDRSWKVEITKQQEI